MRAVEGSMTRLSPLNNSISRALLPVLLAGALGMAASIAVAGPQEPLGGQPPAGSSPSTKDFDYQIKYQRAFEAILWNMPAISIYSFRRAAFENLGYKDNDIIAYSQTATPQLEAITANSTTPYIAAYTDLRKGPVVLEVPAAGAAGSLYGKVVDAWQFTIADVGPAGIVGLLIDALGRSDVTTIAQWVVMPKYALGSPQPKVTWTMVQGLSRLLDVALPEGDLEEQARAWERGVSELVAQDGDMTSYVDTLEHSMDVTELPEASGDAIAEQFEQFLRRRDGDSRRGKQGPGGDTV